jgi:hypothetical protein
MQREPADPLPPARPLPDDDERPRPPRPDDRARPPPPPRPDDRRPPPPPQREPTQRELAAYDASVTHQESRLYHLMRQIRESPYMPTREQTIQIVTTLLTLVLMMLLGPAVGTQAAAIQALVRQVVPLLVAASVHYAANTAAPMEPIQTSAITSAQIEPVQVVPSYFSQAL